MHRCGEFRRNGPTDVRGQALGPAFTWGAEFPCLLNRMGQRCIAGQRPHGQSCARMPCPPTAVSSWARHAPAKAGIGAKFSLSLSVERSILPILTFGSGLLRDALQRCTVRDGDRGPLDTDQAGALPFAQALVDGFPGCSDEIAELALGELQLDGRLS